MLRRLLAVLLLALVASTATPAHAATLTVNVLDCNSLEDGRKTSRFICEAYVSGGTGGNTYSWSAAGTPTNTSGSSTLISYCSVGTSVSVQFTVRDSSGARATASTRFYCYGSL